MKNIYVSEDYFKEQFHPQHPNKNQELPSFSFEAFSVANVQLLSHDFFIYLSVSWFVTSLPKCAKIWAHFMCCVLFIFTMSLVLTNFQLYFTLAPLWETLQNILQMEKMVFEWSLYRGNRMRKFLTHFWQKGANGTL